jgi:hypothetical protein
MMDRFRQAVLWAALAAIVALTFLSFVGAFFGAESAKTFFNSLPLTVYWFALTALLIVGIVIFRRLLQIPSLLLMHLGCVLILLGALWGSNAGHIIQKQLFGVDKIPQAYLKLYSNDHTPKNKAEIEQGQDENSELATQNSKLAPLPFSVTLKDFRMEFYEPGDLIVHSPAGRVWRLAAKPDAQARLGKLGEITVSKVFKNFKLRAEAGRQVPYDAPGGSNPAVQVLVARPDGTTVAGYVFEYFAPVFPEPVGFDVAYQRAVKDYISDVEIVQNDQGVASKAIEVNHPLHYDGYHLYQYSVGEDNGGQYTVLLIVSDSGLNLVYGGYVMLIAGVCWQFWGRRALIALKHRRPVVPRTEEPRE